MNIFSRDLISEIPDLPLSAPSQYLEFCFVMEISDEADESDLLFLKAPHSSEHSGAGPGYPPMIASLLFTGRAEHWIGRISILYWKISVSRSELHGLTF